MMAEPSLVVEVMEVDYDSDTTEIISSPEADWEDEGEGEGEGEVEVEYDNGGTRTPSPHQLISEQPTESPEIGRRRPSVLTFSNTQDGREPVEPRVPLHTEAPPQQQQPQQPPPPQPPQQPPPPPPPQPPPQQQLQEEPHHSSSSTVGLENQHPSPTPPPPVPPDNPQGIAQTSQPVPTEQCQTRSSVSPPAEDAPSVEQSASSTSGAASLPALAGPSTSGASTTNRVSPKRKLEDQDPVQGSQESEDEGQICPICFEPWSNMGQHRLASLRCGHLFGFECISRWLQGTNRQKGRCPQCNAKAVRRDIRVIYAKSIKVLDTTEKERILKELEKEREEKRRLEVEHAQTKLKYELKNQLVVKLQEELKTLKALAKGSGQPNMPASQGREAGNSNKRLVYSEWLDVCREGGCRVMAHNEWLAMLVVSMPSQVGMFPGYGVKKINLLELRVDHYVPLHQKQIRDLAFNPAKHDLLLSVGMDKLAKITNICSNTAVGHFTAPAPLWCCCWSTTESNVFYVGTATGRLQQYDTRNMNGPVATIELPGSGPAVSMTYIHPGPESSITWGGLLVARLQSCFFVEVGMPGEARSHLLPLDGTFTSVSCEADTCHVLVSCRPTQRHPHARHSVCLLQQVNATPEGGGEARRIVTPQPVHTFQGGTAQKVLSRTLLARPPHPDASPLVYASDESTQSIYVWDVSTMTCLQQLRHSDTVVDLRQLVLGNNLHLAALTEKGVRLYRWTN